MLPSILWFIDVYCRVLPQKKCHNLRDLPYFEQQIDHQQWGSSSIGTPTCSLPLTKQMNTLSKKVAAQTFIKLFYKDDKTWSVPLKPYWGANIVEGYSSKVWMKGFLPSQWYVPVSTLLPVSKVLSFSPPQRSWFPNRIPGKLSHVRRISQGQVFSHSEGSRSRLPKKIKIK